MVSTLRRLSTIGSTIILGTCVGMFGSSCGTRGEDPGEVAPRQPARPKAEQTEQAVEYQRVSTGRVYVPTYSHIYAREGSPEDLAITLSIRNVSTQRKLVVESVRYYDTAGTLIEEFMDAESVLSPLETAEFFIPTADRRGGSGANVVVSWHADSPVVKPLIEAVMIRSVNTNQAYAFSTRGIDLPTDAPLPDTASNPPPATPKAE